MNTHQTNTIGATLVLFLFGLAQAKFDVTLVTGDESAKALVLFADFNFPYVVIQDSNLNCNELDSCEWLNNDRQTGRYMDQEYEYTEAFVNFKFKMAGETPSGHNKHKIVKVTVRVSDYFNVLGVNDKTTFPNLIDPGHEFIFDLKTKEITVQQIKKEQRK